MDIGKTLQPSDWLTSGAVITGGLDLLGLRLPVQFIGGTLLDGVTTVTPSVRYLAFRAWLIHRYGQTGGGGHRRGEGARPPPAGARSRR